MLGERGLKSEISSLLVDKSSLEARINSLISSRAGEKQVRVKLIIRRECCSGQESAKISWAIAELPVRVRILTSCQRYLVDATVMSGSVWDPVGSLIFTEPI